MMTPGYESPVPPFHALGNGTVEHGREGGNVTRNEHGTISLKALADKVLTRNKEWNKAGTTAKNDGTTMEQQISFVEQNPLEVTTAYELEERAAIIEYEAGIPSEWAEAFARVCCMEKPASIPASNWQRIIGNTGRMLDHPEHIRSFERHGWAVGDIFGVHPGAPERRQDAKGLLLLMQEGEVISIINEQVIGLQRTGSGALLCYYRPRPVSAERAMLWELR